MAEEDRKASGFLAAQACIVGFLVGAFVGCETAEKIARVFGPALVVGQEAAGEETRAETGAEAGHSGARAE